MRIIISNSFWNNDMAFLTTDDDSQVLIWKFLLSKIEFWHISRCYMEISKHSMDYSISITWFLLPLKKRFCKLSVVAILLLFGCLSKRVLFIFILFTFFIMNIYVGNLNYRVKEDDLQKVMEDYGTVSYCISILVGTDKYLV